MKFLLLISILISTASLHVRAKEQIVALLPNELAAFKNQWQCIGLTLVELERQLGEGKLKLGQNNNQLPVYIFEKFDAHPENKINWKIEVTMWQDQAGEPPIAHQVRYKRGKRFSQEELDGLREINAKGLKWEKNGQTEGWRRYRTAMPRLPARPINDKQPALMGGDRNEVDERPGAHAEPLCKDTVIYTQALNQHRLAGMKPVMNSIIEPLFGVGINDHIDKLRDKIKKLGAVLVKVDHGQHQNNNSLFINRYRCPEINLWSKGKWEIQASTWAGTGIIHEISYTKLDGPINIRTRKGLIHYNIHSQQALAVSTPVMLPTKDKPISIRIRAKQLDELLAFQDQWRCIGLTLEQLQQRFGKGKLKLGQVDSQFPVFIFEKFDAHPENKINWQIEVTMWQDQAGEPAVAHQVRYERMKKFTQKELSWLREINAQGLTWEKKGQQGVWRRYTTATPVLPNKPLDDRQIALISGDKNEVDPKPGEPVKLLCKETVIYSQAINQMRQGKLVTR